MASLSLIPDQATQTPLLAEDWTWTWVPGEKPTGTLKEKPPLSHLLFK